MDNKKKKKPLKYVLVFILTISTITVFGQNKKYLMQTIDRLQADSTALEFQIKGNNLKIDSLKKEIFNSKELQNKFREKNQNSLERLLKNEELINKKESVIRLLKDSINALHEIIKNPVKENKVEYYIIEDPDGYSNLREVPGGKVIREVYSGDKFKIIGEEKDHKKVEFSDSSTGFIHKSRVVKFNDKVCECLQAADNIIKKDLDKDFTLGSKTGFPDNGNPTYDERLVKIFQYQSPTGCDFLADPSWIGIDINSEVIRCSE